MCNNNQVNKSLCAKDILCHGQKYFIPNYQRNYAWEIEEVRQLIQDVADTIKRKSGEYYVGNLIVRLDPTDPESCYETIDGQQRLTTLFIIICALRKEKDDYNARLNWFSPDSLQFRNRKNSTASLRAISSGDFETSEDRENHIIDVCRSVFPIIDDICQKDCGGNIDGFVEFFMNSVKFLRIEIPQGVDRNHYFEVMNSRGVQLTPSEVVKAEMMQALVNEPSSTSVAFSVIWNACANMERYVVMNIPSSLRPHFFGGKWTTNPVVRKDLSNDGLGSRFDELSKLIVETKLDYSESDIEPKSLKRALFEFENGIELKTNGKSSNNDEEDNQYYSVISFPNFLIHVLRILYPRDRSAIPLDDKELSKTFHSYIKKEGAQFVKEFSVILLRSRFLFDKFVVRRDSHEKWVLNQVVENQNKPEYKKTFGEGNNNDKDNEILLLLEMFHVSNPTQNHKNWLSAVLSFVSQYPETSMSQYLDYLRSLALSFIRKRFLTNSQENYDDFLFNDDGSVVNNPSEGAFIIDESLLDKGVNVENFVFNYYDYLLWSEPKDSRCSGINYDQFEYSYRNSVEHFYPQHPRSDELLSLQDKFPDIGEKLLNCFGNLCLITPSQNSRFTNDPPKAKYERFKNNTETTKQSLKLQRMFSIVENGDWDKNEIDGLNTEAHELFVRRIS